MCRIGPGARWTGRGAVGGLDQCGDGPFQVGAGSLVHGRWLVDDVSGLGVPKWSLDFRVALVHLPPHCPYTPGGGGIFPWRVRRYRFKPDWDNDKRSGTIRAIRNLESLANWGGQKTGRAKGGKHRLIQPSGKRMLRRYILKTKQVDRLQTKGGIVLLCRKGCGVVASGGSGDKTSREKMEEWPNVEKRTNVGTR